MLSIARVTGVAVVAASLGLSAIGFAPLAPTDVASQLDAQLALAPPVHDTGYIPVGVGTPDEALLHYQVMVPDPAVYGDGPYPAVIDYSGYLPAVTIYDGLADRFRDAGYAVVGLNIRGTGCSSGKFNYFEPVQSRDGADAIGWLAEQDWSNGRLGMVGKSYPGITQSFVAAEQPEALKAIVPGNIFADLYRDVPFPGGMMNVTFAGGWSAQRVYEGNLYAAQHTATEEVDQQCLANQAQHVQNPAYNPLALLLQEQFDSPTYRERSPWEFADRIDVPTFLVESWQDEQVGSRGTHLLERLRTDEIPWKFLATNGDHGEYYGGEVLPHILRFLDYHLKQQVPAADVVAGESFEDAYGRYLGEDPVIINWENGANGGRSSAFTTTHAAWPVPEQEVLRYELTPAGGLTDGLAPRGEVDYLYAPVVGAEERGGHSIADEPAASWSDRAPEGTFAAFTTEPLTQDAMLLGSGSVDLWLSSSAVDTDVEVTLSEIRADGQEMFVQQGWLRASHRVEDARWSNELRPFQTHLLTDVTPLVPGTPSLLRVELFPFGHAFREGSRIRISVAAPHTRPDLWGFAVTPVAAANTVHTGGAYRSSVSLPLVAGATAPTDYPDCTLRNQPCR